MPLPFPIGVGRAIMWHRREPAGSPPPPGPLGNPTFVAETSTVAAGDVTAPVPAGTLDGHFMLAAHTTANNQVIATPSGWNLLLASGGAGTERLRTYWRVASSEPASYIWDSNLGNNNTVSIVTYSDTAATSPIDGTPTENTATSSTATALGLTTTNDNTLLIMVVWPSGSRTFTDGSWSVGAERVDVFQTVGSAPSLGIGDGVQPTAGASGNKTVTISGSTGYFAQLIAVKPSGA